MDSIPELTEKEEMDFEERTYKIVIDGYVVRCGKFEEAERMVFEMKDRGFAVGLHVWNPIVSEYCKKGFVEKAGSLFDKMVKGGVDFDQATEMIGSRRVVVGVSICSEVCRRLCFLNRFDKVKVLVDVMLAANDAAARLATEICEEVSKPDIREPV